MPHSLIPVTVLSGFLGSGKTTLLKNILMNRGGMKIALIVNDMSELNIDAHEIEREVALSRTEETLVEMSNGCVCCTLRDDLLKAVESLAKEEKYDAIVIETTGISEPVPIAQTFSFVDEESGIDLSKYARLDTMVTVVDASEFLKNFSSQESLKDRGEVADEHDVRTIVDLMTEQVEFCDIIVVNKTELIDSESLEIVRKILTGLNPTAQRIETSFGKVAIERVINT